MATIFNHFYGNKNAFLNPCDITEKISGFPEVCITTFSESIIRSARLCSRFGGNHSVRGKENRTVRVLRHIKSIHCRWQNNSPVVGCQR